MTSETYPPCHEVCKSEDSTKCICPENEHIFLFSEEAGGTVPVSTDGFPAESFSFHIWEMHLLSDFLGLTNTN